MINEDFSDEEQLNQETSSCEDEDSSTLNFKHTVSFVRYLNPRNAVKKSAAFMENVLPSLDEARFRQELRMSREGFARVISVISKYEGFFDDSKHPQRALELQLAVALFGFGHFGNGVSQGLVTIKIWNIRRSCRRIRQPCYLCVGRPFRRSCKMARLRERCNIKRRIFAAYGSSNCIGYVDGTLVVLETCPPFERRKLL